MQVAFPYAFIMANVQIRNVPEALHRKLKARAASLGLSLSDYLLREVSQAVERPSMEEFLEHLRTRPLADIPDGLVAGIIREERDNR